MRRVPDAVVRIGRKDLVTRGIVGAEALPRNRRLDREPVVGLPQERAANRGGGLGVRVLFYGVEAARHFHRGLTVVDPAAGVAVPGADAVAELVVDDRSARGVAGLVARIA